MPTITVALGPEFGLAFLPAPPGGNWMRSVWLQHGVGRDDQLDSRRCMVRTFGVSTAADLGGSTVADWMGSPGFIQYGDRGPAIDAAAAGRRMVDQLPQSGSAGLGLRRSMAVAGKPTDGRFADTRQVVATVEDVCRAIYAGEAIFHRVIS
jgi:hypothetical protein